MDFDLGMMAPMCVIVGGGAGNEGTTQEDSTTIWTQEDGTTVVTQEDGT